MTLIETLIETRKRRDIQSDNEYEEKIPYMQTFRLWYLTYTADFKKN